MVGLNLKHNLSLALQSLHSTRLLSIYHSTTLLKGELEMIKSLIFTTSVLLLFTACGSYQSDTGAQAILNSEDDINKLLEGDDDDEDLLKSLKDGDESSSDDTELTDEEVKALLGDYSDTDSNDDSSDDDTELTDDEVKALLGDDESDDDDDTELTDEEKKALE
jgi:hypothetical protein